MKQKIYFSLFIIACFLSFKSVNAQCLAPTSASASVVNATCINNAKITISGVSGGTALSADTTLEYAINSYSGTGTVTTGIYQKDSVFTNLYPGTYSISVRKDCFGTYSSDYLITSIVVTSSYVTMLATVAQNWPEANCKLGRFTVAASGGNKTISGTYYYQLVTSLSAGLYDTLSAKQTHNYFNVSAGVHYIRVYDDCGNYVTRAITITGSSTTTNPYKTTATYNKARFLRTSCSTFRYSYFRPASLRFSTHNLTGTNATTYLYGPDLVPIDSFSGSTTGYQAVDITSYINPTYLRVLSSLNCYGPFFEKVVDSCGTTYYSDTLYVDTSIALAGTLTRINPRCDTGDYVLVVTQIGNLYAGVPYAGGFTRVKISNIYNKTLEFTNDSGATWATNKITDTFFNVPNSAVLAKKFGVRVCGREYWPTVPAIPAYNPTMMQTNPWACENNTGISINPSGNFGEGSYNTATVQITSAPAGYPYPLSMIFNNMGQNALSTTDKKRYLNNIPTGTYAYTITNDCGQTYSSTITVNAGRKLELVLKAVGSCATGIVQVQSALKTTQLGSTTINAIGGSTRFRYSLRNSRTGIYCNTGAAAGATIRLGTTTSNPILNIPAMNTKDSGWHVLTIWPDSALLFTGAYCPVVDSIYINNSGTSLKASSDFVSCKMGGTGTITANQIGGIPPYKYELEDLTLGTVSPMQYSPVFTGLDISHSYRVRVTDTCGNSSSTSNTFDTLTTYTYKVGLACEGNTIELKSNDVPSGTYRWVRGTDTLSYSRVLNLTNLQLSDSGLYYSYIQTAGCSDNIVTAYHLTVNPRPAKPIVTDSILNYCVGETAEKLEATGTFLKWTFEDSTSTTSDTSFLPSTTVADTFIYYVNQSSDSGCVSYNNSIQVRVNPVPNKPIVSNAIYCQFDSASALSAIGTNLKWYDTAIGGAPSSTAPVPSTLLADTLTYYVSQTSIAGCESERAALGVRINARPDTPIASSIIQYCQNETSVALSAVGSSLLWYDSLSGGTGSSVAPTPSTSIVGTRIYYVSQSNSYGCESNRKSIAVVTNPNPAKPTVVSPVTYCQNYPSTALTATGTSLKWYTVDTGGIGTSTAPTPSTLIVDSTHYFVSQTNSYGCESKRAQITVNINPTPLAPTAITTINYCQDDTASALTATGTNLLWYTTASGGTGTTTAPTPSTSSAGTTKYYVSQSNSYSCESPRTEISVNVHPTPSAPIVTSPIKYCNNDLSDSLSAIGTNLLWYNTASGGIGSSTAPIPNTATVGSQYYYVSQTSAFGCEGPRSTIKVNINPIPAKPSVVSPVEYCNHAPASPLTAIGDSLKWYTLASGGIASLSAPTPSTSKVGSEMFYVSQTSLEACESERAAIEVQVHPNPSLTLKAIDNIDFVFCPGFDVLIKAIAPTAISYQWMLGTTPISGAIHDSLRIAKEGLYKVTVTNLYNCTTTDSVYVWEDSTKAPILSPTDVYMCDGTDLKLYTQIFSKKAIYKWYQDGTQIVPSIDTLDQRVVSKGGVYKVIVINEYGCVQATNNAIINVYPAVAPVKISKAASRLSVAKIYSTYQWFRNGKKITGANQFYYDLSFNGTYYVVVKDKNGCEAISDTINIQTLGVQHSTATNQEIKIFPNPTAEKINIQSPIAIDAVLTDLSGRKVLSVQKATVMDISQLADGNYILILKDQEGSTIGVERITKQAQ